jgi:hypothetical protein
MSKLVTSIFILFVSVMVRGQSATMPAVDRSPMDMSYYPTNYPILKIQDKITEPLVARVTYSRPQKSGRVIFGGLIKYGEIWRMGANEATEIEFFKHVRIGGKRVPKGRYTLYAQVFENTWTIILNKETDTWGAFKYSPKKDLVRIEVPVQKSDGMLESLSMMFEKSNEGIHLVIAWDMIKVEVPITF